MDSQRRPLVNQLPLRDPLHSKKPLVGHRHALPSIQTIFILLWCATCTATVYWRLPTTDIAMQWLLLFYMQPLLPVLLMLWLWVVNVRSFEQQGIDYESCFSLRDRKLLPHADDLTRLGLSVGTVLLAYSAAFTALAAAHMYQWCELLPLALYAGLLLLLLAPANVLSRPSRLFFASTLRRVLLPVQEVSWADFLLADMLCSLSWTTFNLAQVFCSLATGPSMRSMVLIHRTEPAVCSPLSVPMLVGLCLPYIIRCIQCCIVYRTSGNTAQLFNALKYFTSFPALVLAAQEHEAHVSQRPFPLMRLWLTAQLLNTMYSTYWDIEFDWDMPWLVMPGARRIGLLRLPMLRPDALYSGAWYGWLLSTNVLLRMTWTHRLLGDLESHATVGLAMAALEVFRRHQWAYVRVETELRKVRAKMEHSKGDPSLIGSSSSSAAGGVLEERSAAVALRHGGIDAISLSVGS